MILNNVKLNDKVVDILIENGKILNIGKSEALDIDCKGLTILPAFCDMHTHLREPGQTAKEDIESGTSAAVAGGYSDVCCMPNTTPVIDCDYMVEYIKLKADKVGKCNVHPIGAITKGSNGELMAEYNKMKDKGAIAFSDDGKPVANPNVMKQALEYAKDIDALMLCHCEDMSLTNGGVCNEGKVATALGLKGIVTASEELDIAKQIILAEMLDTKVHICHISTKGSVQLIREAKARGVKVSCETCPHYVAGTEDLVDGYNTFAKVNPPLRTEADRLAIIEGIKDGTIDCIATDHAPHTFKDKHCTFNDAANGISGLETAFSLCYTYLVKTGEITLDKLVELMSINPRKLLNLPTNEIKEGNIANIALVDLDNNYKIDSTTFKSKGKNTPFNDYEVYGKIAKTIVNGIIKFEDGVVKWLLIT